MSLPDALSSAYRHYATGSGRAGRSEFWWYYLTILIVYVQVWVVAVLSIAVQGDADHDDAIVGAATVISVLWLLANVIPIIAATVRRLHDVGMSGWFYLLQFVPYIGSFVLLIIMVLPGNRGSNIYGVDPREDRHADGRAGAASFEFGDARFGAAAPYQARITPVASIGPQPDPRAPQDPLGHQPPLPPPY